MTKALTFLFAGLLAAGAVSLNAQVRKKTENKLSPSASASMQLAGGTVTVEYNAPSARGRQVEGGLIPYGKVWRTGADAATTLTTDVDLTIGDLKVPKGSYTLYTLAAPDGWLLIVNKQTGQWGTQYDESQDLGRVPLKLTALSVPVEKFEITLASDTYSMKWGKTEASVPVKAAK
ncbi:MAG: DUF2911 domain-containing protein [Acidobacteriota bacterium]